MCLCICVGIAWSRCVGKGKIVGYGLRYVVQAALTIILEAFSNFVLYCDFIHSYHAAKCVFVLTATTDGTENERCFYNLLMGGEK